MLRVEPLHDQNAINDIMRSSEIAPKLRHDGREPGYIDHPLASYWGAWVGEELVGVFLAVRFSKWEVEAHVAITRRGLGSARDLSQMFLICMFEDADIERVTGYVTGTLRSAGNFCRRLGFEYEGKRRDACRVNGALHDVLIYGLTRADWRLRGESA